MREIDFIPDFEIFPTRNSEESQLQQSRATQPTTEYLNVGGNSM